MARRVDIEKKLLDRNIRPVRKDGVFVLLDEVPAEVKTSGGIVLLGPAISGSRNDRSGTIIGVGKEVQDLKRGTRVIVNKVYGTPVPHDDMGVCHLKYVSADQIDAVLEGPEEAEDYDHYRASV